MPIDHVAVIGAGTMGSGIARAFLQHGFTVTVIDTNAAQLNAAMDRIQEEIDADADTGDMTVSTDIAAVADTDLILEAVPEDRAIKADVFEEAAQHNQDAIYASNTSSIRITELAEHTPDRSRCVGMHFFNPAPVMDIIELVVTDNTDTDTVEAVRAVADRLGKAVSEVRDVPGFASNRILMPFINEAIKILAQDIAAKEDIDRIATEGFNHPMGPLELADFIGLDVCNDIMQQMYDETGENRFQPADLLQEKVENGDLGKKTGKGFYTYD
jgi:3-hydroxybutyryl-CoA dehydrogenase